MHNELCKTKTGGRRCIAHGHFTFWKGCDWLVLRLVGSKDVVGVNVSFFIMEVIRAPSNVRGVSCFEKEQGG